MPGCLPTTSPALFGRRLLLSAMVHADPAMVNFDVLDLTTERETTTAECDYAVRLQSFIAASVAMLAGATA